jgi:hypothetical protein
MSLSVKRFILFGDSGAGKSSFVNTFYNYCYGTRNPDDVFNKDQKGVQLAIPCKHWLDRINGDETSSERDINDQTKSQTMKCTQYKLCFDNLTIELIDTPGFNDSDGTFKDDNSLHQIEEMLQAIPYLSGIIIIANGSVARLGTSFSHFMRLLHEVWPNNLMQNVCVVLTNCDDNGCSLSSQILHTDLKVTDKTTFYLQNTLFRWDRTARTSKIIRNLRRDFEDVVITLDKLVPVLSQFNDVSTNIFRVGAIRQSRIQECIVTSIEHIIDLLKVNRLQRIVADGLSGAKVTMTANKNWEKQASITAFKWMEVEPSRSHSTSNNSSIFHPDDTYQAPSSYEHDTAKSRLSQDLDYEAAYSESEYDNYDSHFKSSSSSPDKMVTTEAHLAKNVKHNTSPTRVKHNEYNSNSYLQNNTSNVGPTACPRVSFNINEDNFASAESAEHQPMRSPESQSSGRKSNYYSNFRSSPKGATKEHDDDHQHKRESRVPRGYQRQDVKLQVTLSDNEAKSYHEVARHQAEILRDKAVQFAREHDHIVDSTRSLLGTLKGDVHEMREINADVDLLERNMTLIGELRNEIKLGGDEPTMIDFYTKVVRILSKEQ